MGGIYLSIVGRLITNRSATLWKIEAQQLEILIAGWIIGFRFCLWGDRIVINYRLSTGKFRGITVVRLTEMKSEDSVFVAGRSRLQLTKSHLKSSMKVGTCVLTIVESTTKLTEWNTCYKVQTNM